MNHILELARRLGNAIAESPQAARLRDARKAMRAEEGLQQKITEFQTRVDKIAKLQEQNKPIEVEDKHKLQELQDNLLASGAFKEYTAMQVEYVDLMRTVNEALRKELVETESE